MRPRLSRALRGAQQVLLTVGAVVGVLCILVTIGAALFGVRPLVFRSGSMAPTIDTGALAIARSADGGSLEKGQIVSVPTPTGQRVTHRIVHVEHQGHEAVLTLKGDANDAADAQPYRVTHADKVLLSVPEVGYFIGWLSGPAGLFLLGLYAAFLLSVLFRRAPVTPQAGPLGSEMRVVPPSPGAGPRKTPRKKRGARLLNGGLSAVLMVGLAAGLVVQRTVSPTLAAWTDSATVSGTTLTAATVGVPGSFSCAKVSSKPKFSWTAVSPVTSYTVYLDSGGSSVTVTPPATSYSLSTNPSTSQTAWVVANRQFASAIWTSAETAHLTYQSNGNC